MALEMISYEVVVRDLTRKEIVERTEKTSRSDAIDLARVVNANDCFRAEVYQLVRRAINVQ